MLLVVAKIQKKAVDALTPQDELGRKKGWVSRNQTAASIELAALESAARKHVNLKKNKSVDQTKKKSIGKRNRPRKRGPAPSKQSTECEELTRYRNENAMLKAETASLRRDLLKAQNVDKILWFITGTLEEARESATNAAEWEHVKKRLKLTFHPDKNAAKQMSNDVWVAMQNHHLYQVW